MKEMASGHSSIAELQALVEQLAGLLAEVRLDLDQCQADQALDAQVEGRPLRQHLAELWPALAAPEGPPLCEQALKDRQYELRRQSSKLENVIDRKRTLVVKGASRLGAERRRLRQRAQDADAELERLRAIGLRLGPEQKAVNEKVRQLESQTQAMGRWLEGLAPKGLAGFRDASGRQVNEKQAAQAQARMNQMLARAVSLRAKAQVLAQAQSQARAKVSAAAAQLSAAKRAVAGFGSEQAGRIEGLKRAERQVEAKRVTLAGLQKQGLGLMNLSMRHRELLVAAAAWVEPVLSAPAPDFSAALQPAQEAADSAGWQAKRAGRLAKLLTRLENRLIPRAQAVTEALKDVRLVNKEIKSLEDELPGLLAPLTHRDQATPQARASAAVGLSTVLARITELLPRAEATGQMAEDLRLRLRLGSDRGRRWQDAWRVAGRAERRQMDAARALAAEAAHGAEKARKNTVAQVESLAPLVGALGQVTALEALPSLAAAVQTILTARQEAAKLHKQAMDLDQGLGRPSVGNLAKPPAAIKPFTAAARRMAGKKVNLENLRALAQAVDHWRSLLSEPLFENARRQAEEVALALGGSLGRMAAERQKLLAARGRSAGLLRGLRRDIFDQRQRGQAIAQRLAEMRQKSDDQAQRINEFERQMVQTRAELARSIELQRIQAKENSELRSDLDQVREHANRQAGELGRYRRELADTRGDLDITRQAHHDAQIAANRMGAQLDATRAEKDRQGKLLEITSAELGQARRQRSAAVKSYRTAHSRGEELAIRLDQAESQLELVGRSLNRHSALSAALKSKSLERHGLLRSARASLAELKDLQRVTLARETELDRARAELTQARSELQKTHRAMRQAVAQRDQTAQALAAEQSARARQAMDLLQGQALSVELAATQSEAGRWATLAGDLSAALAAAGLKHEAEAGALRQEIESLASEAEVLKAQLGRIANMVSVADMPDILSAPPASAPRRGPAPAQAAQLSPQQVDRALARVGAMRRRIRRLGRSALGHWALIAALTTSLLLLAPGTSTKANRTDAPLKAPRLAVPRAVHDLNIGPVLDLPVSGHAIDDAMGNGRLVMNLLPIRPTRQPLPASVKRQVRLLAAEAGLSPQVLVTSARALFAGRSAVEPKALKEVAAMARSLAARHPLIFRELAKEGLPITAAALAAVEPSPEKAQHLFLDRMYAEYRNLGFGAEEALGALAANEAALKKMNRAWSPPKRYWGKTKPVKAIEQMKLKEFLDRMTTYIKSKLKVFLKQRGMTYAGDLDRYTKNLAFDMYCAAKKYKVPVTFLLAIAHQETWYANVLGDVGRSASPFQIFEPTRHLIRLSMQKEGMVPPPKGVKLEHHLTMATYMAAFHLRELMAQSIIPKKNGRKAMVNMDKVLKRYNGSSRYPPMVAKRQRALARYVN